MIIYKLRNYRRVWVCSWGDTVTIGLRPLHNQYQEFGTRKEAKLFAQCLRDANMDVNAAVRAYAETP